MSKLTQKIAVPIILVVLFAIAVFVAIYHDQLNWDFYVVFLFFVIYVFFFGIATGQSLSSPVKKILDRAKELSKGNLSSRIYLETKDEFAELAKAFNKIAEELETSHQNEASTEKSVDIKVKARTQALEETINALDQKVRNRTAELEKLVDKSNKLQSDAKNKETEVAQLKKELGDFKQKLGKVNKSKEPVSNNL